MTENFSNLEVRKKVTQIQESHRVLIKMNPKSPTPRYNIIKISNVKYKERNLTATRER